MRTGIKGTDSVLPWCLHENALVLHWGQLCLKPPVWVGQGRQLLGLLSQRIKIPWENCAITYILVPSGSFKLNNSIWITGKSPMFKQSFYLLFCYKYTGYKWMSLTFLQLVPCGRESRLNRILFFLWRKWSGKLNIMISCRDYNANTYLTIIVSSSYNNWKHLYCALKHYTLHYN